MLLHRPQHFDQLLLLLLALADGLDERVLQQLLRALPLARRLPQAAVHEVYEVVAALGQLGRVAVDDALHGQVVLHPQKGRLSFNQLDGHHAQRPNVHLLIVRLLLYQLRSHPSRRAHQRLPAQDLLGELDSEPKIGDLDFSLQTHEHVIALEVAMQLPPTVQALQPFQHILQYIRNDVLWHLFEVIVDEVDHGSAVHELHEHEQRFLVVVGEVVAGEVGRVAQVHHCDFGADLVQGAVVFELYDAAGVVLPVGFGAVVGEEDLAHRPLPQLFLEDELARWVFFDEVDVLYHRLELAGRQQLGLDVALDQRRVVFLLEVTRDILRTLGVL